MGQRFALRPYRTIRIGEHDLRLNLRIPHERRYWQDPETIDVLIARSLLRPGDRVVDAGANIGFTTLVYLREGAGEVLAFEPVSSLAARLQTIGDPRLTVYPLALSDHAGSGEIYLSRSHNQGNSVNPGWLQMFPKVFGGKVRSETIRLETLDQVLDGRAVDFVKVDIEGSELAFLQGCQRTLSQAPPRILQIELYPSQFAEAHELLSRTYRYCRRASVHRGSGALALLAADDQSGLQGGEYLANPPIYLYANAPLGEGLQPPASTSSPA